MSQGTVYCFPGSPRSIFVDVLVKYFNLDINSVDVGSVEDATYIKNFPLKKTPAFIGEKGFKLHEVIAISYYCM